MLENHEGLRVLNMAYDTFRVIVTCPKFYELVNCVYRKEIPERLHYCYDYLDERTDYEDSVSRGWRSYEILIRVSVKRILFRIAKKRVDASYVWFYFRFRSP